MTNRPDRPKLPCGAWSAAAGSKRDLRRRPDRLGHRLGKDRRVDRGSGSRLGAIRSSVESLQAEGLIPIDASVLAQAMPGAAREPGEAPLRRWPPITPRRELRPVGPVRHAGGGNGRRRQVCDRRGRRDGSPRPLGHLPRVRKQFAFDFCSACRLGNRQRDRPVWKAVARGAVRSAAGRAGPRSFAPAVPPGVEYRVNFRALRTPPGWLADWKSFDVELPVFSIIGASRDEGAVAVQGRDDMTVQPQRLDRLVPLGESEKARSFFPAWPPSWPIATTIPSIRRA